MQEFQPAVLSVRPSHEVGTVTMQGTSVSSLSGGSGATGATATCTDQVRTDNPVDDGDFSALTLCGGWYRKPLTRKQAPHQQRRP